MAHLHFIPENHFRTVGEMQALKTKDLYWYFKSVRMTCSYIEHYEGDRCCEMCHEFLGTPEEWRNEIVPRLNLYESHLRQIKKQLSLRPDQFTWNKKDKKKRKKLSYRNRKGYNVKTN
tara:strand:- start:49 stop:402 length:354 start_codon:yes stop_codon:yes gene_type:complete